VNQKNRLSASLGTTWSNKNYMQSYFGVTPAQSLSSGYNIFNASSGVSDVKLSGSWSHQIDSNWSLTTGVSVKYLTGDAAKSPFVFRKTPVTIFSAVSYRF